MTASIWTGDTTLESTANADNSYRSQRFTATAGQVLFTLTTFSYQTGTGSLDVFINGVSQYITNDFTETSNTSVTLVTAVEAGDSVVIRGLIGSTGASAAADSASAAETAADAAEAALDEIENLALPSLPLTVANGGTGSSTAATARTALGVTLDNISPVTTKGDLILRSSTTQVRLPVGTAGQALIVDSSTPTGVKWGSATLNTVASTVTTNTTASSTPSIYPCATTAIGKCITAPDATSLPLGLFAIIDNSAGTYPVGWRDSTGALVGKNCVRAGGIGHVYLEANSAAGTWFIEGTNLESGLSTIDNTFSSTYAVTIQKPFVALDSNKSIHFLLNTSSDLYAVAVDNTTGAVGTPVLILVNPATVNTVFAVTSTTAIVFYNDNTNSKAVILSLSGATTLTVGTEASTAGLFWSAENFSGAPKIAQLSSTLYLTSYTSGTNTSVRAISVSGTSVTIGAAANIDTGGVVANSTTTYPLTSTTGLVISFSSGTPNTIRATVISISGTTCTVGTKVDCATQTDISTPPSSCLLSATKVLVGFPITSTNYPQIAAITISAGTTVTWGTAVQLEATAVANFAYTDGSATRYNPHLFTLSSSTALAWYLDGSGLSRAVVLSESGGVVTQGTKLYRSFSVASSGSTGFGAVLSQGTSEFLAITQEGAANAWQNRLVPHKISGTTITYGNSVLAPEFSPVSLATALPLVRLSTNNYVGIGANASYLPVIKSNGDYINNRGSISIPNMIGLTAYPLQNVSSNRVVILASTRGTTVSSSTEQLRLLSVEIAQ